MLSRRSRISAKDHFRKIDKEGLSTEAAPAQLFMLLSSIALTSASASRTLQLVGTIAGNKVYILINSGSSHPFLEVASHLPGAQLLSQPVVVHVADGGTID